MSESVKTWVKAATIRAVKTAAQTAAAIISVGTVMQDIDWIMVASASGLSAILSILTSIGGLPEVESGQSVAKIINAGEDN
jgi:hypothetical protein